MINITNIAQKHFAKLLADKNPGTQIRVFVINPGTPEAECGVSYCSLDNVSDNDIKIKFDLLSVYIDKLDIPYLTNAEIDLTIENLNSQLTLKAPNAKKNIIDDANTPLFERVQHMLNMQINPILASHNGKVFLVKITDNMCAVLQFSGGCNGCLMIDYTLKEEIEKRLLKKFPELKKIDDITNHDHGSHSYY